MLIDEKLSKTTEPFYLELGLCSSITDNVETMNSLIQERNNHSDTCTRIRVERVTQIFEVCLAIEESSLAIWSTHLAHVFGGGVRNDLGIPMRGKGLHKPTFAHDSVRIHSLMIYTDIIECNFVGDKKAPLLCCFPSISKLKYMNYQTLSNLQFRPLLKNFLHSIHVDLQETSGERIPFISMGRTRLVLVSRKVSDMFF